MQLVKYEGTATEDVNEGTSTSPVDDTFGFKIASQTTIPVTPNGQDEYRLYYPTHVTLKAGISTSSPSTSICTLFAGFSSGAQPPLCSIVSDGSGNYVKIVPLTGIFHHYRILPIFVTPLGQIVTDPFKITGVLSPSGSVIWKADVVHVITTVPQTIVVESAIRSIASVGKVNNYTIVFTCPSRIPQGQFFSFKLPKQRFNYDGSSIVFGNGTIVATAVF